MGYDLSHLQSPLPKVSYDPEIEFALKGKVTNLFNKPISNAHVMLVASGDEKFVKDTITDQSGIFLFKKLPSTGKPTFVISARNKKGRIIEGGIGVDENNKVPVGPGNHQHLKPWNVNTDITLLNFVKLNNTYQATLYKDMSEQLTAGCYNR